MFPIIRMPVNRKIALGLFRFDQSPFGLFDAFQNGRLAGRVLVNTDAEVHFVGIGISDKSLCQTENGVGRRGRKVRKVRFGFGISRCGHVNEWEERWMVSGFQGTVIDNEESE